jgi:hypothetical protein
MIRSPAGFDGGDRIKRYLDYYQPSYGVMMLSAGQFSPASLFAAGEQGAWYDPSDFSTMFQNSAGTTPVTAVEQPVGLIRDKSGRNNHASQATSASCPVLSARVNLLTYSEQFDNAAWTKFGATVVANSATAPNGTTTADLIYPANTAAFRGVYQNVSANSYSVYAKASGKNWLALINISGAAGAAWFNLSAGTVGTVVSGYTATIESAGNGWYLCKLSHASNFVQAFYYATDADNTSTATVNGTDGVLLWGADLRVTNDGVGIPAYQRVAAATDYDTSGFPLYLRFDGTDDSLSTASIDFSATDKMSVFAGVRKLNDASGGLISELGNVSAGGWYLYPGNWLNASGAFYTFAGRGSAAGVFGQAVQTGTYTAPITNVLTATGNISGDLNTLQVNGVAGTNATADQGTGNYANDALYIGRRGGTTLPFNGRLYSLIVRGAQSTTAQITSTETWVNGKTKAY